MIRLTPVYSEAEVVWRSITSRVPQMIISIITGCFHLCSGIPLLKTEALYCGGKCLRLLSLYTNMDSANRWMVDDQVIQITQVLFQHESPQTTDISLTQLNSL